ncbi:MAG TPA: SHOCT domain-containing protein [Williamwhitmania sp.]|nr:SHOCT domain-containing protein [Williamwhitmania sp.]
MNSAEEINRLKKLLDQGAISEDEFQTLKKKVLSKAKFLHSEESSILKDGSNQENEVLNTEGVNDSNLEIKNSENKAFPKDKIAQYISIASLIYLVAMGIYLGSLDNSYISILLIIPISIVIYLFLFKALQLKFSKLISSLIMLSFPILIMASQFFNVNLYSKFTYNPNIKRVITYQYNAHGEKIPYEIYFIRKDSFEIVGGDTIYLKTGMHELFDENGIAKSKGLVENGIMRGEWFAKDKQIAFYCKFDNSINYDSILLITNHFNTQKEYYESYSMDIKVGKDKIVTNGFLDGSLGEEKLYGVFNGSFSIYYNDRIYVNGRFKYGYLDGICKYYTPEGKIYKTINYKNGNPFDLTVIDENIKTEPVQEMNGRERIVTSKLFNGNYHGSCKYYDKYGEVIAEGLYVDGNKHGKWKYYGRFEANYYSSEEYILTSIENYYNGHLHGLQTHYWSANGHYSDEIGNVVNYTEMYRYGKRHGKMTKYSSSETRKSKKIWYTEDWIDGELVENSTKYY